MRGAREDPEKPGTPPPAHTHTQLDIVHATQGISKNSRAEMKRHRAAPGTAWSWRWKGNSHIRTAAGTNENQRLFLCLDGIWSPSGEFTGWSPGHCSVLNKGQKGHLVLTVQASLAAQWLRIRLPSRRLRFDPWDGKIPWRRAWQPHSTILAWRIPRSQEPGGLQSTGSQRVRHSWVTKQQQQGTVPPTLHSPADADSPTESYNDTSPRKTDR